MTASERCKICTLFHRRDGKTPLRCPSHRDLLWPLAPLVALIDHQDAKDLCRLLRCSPGSLRRWAEFGVPDETADRLACRAGWHPGSVWPDWFDAGLTVVDRRRLEGNGWRQAWVWAENHTDVISAPEYPTTPVRPGGGDLAANAGTSGVAA